MALFSKRTLRCVYKGLDRAGIVIALGKVWKRRNRGDQDGLKCLQSEPGGCDEQPPNLLSVDKNLRKRSPTEHVTANQRATRPNRFQREKV